MTDDALVIFTPSGKRGRFALGTPVLTAARQLGVDLDSVCGGRGICSKCQITPGYGEFSKHGVTVAADALSEWNAVEERYKRIRGLLDGRRLGCQAKVMGDVVIDVPPESQVHKQVIRKSATERVIVMDPATRLLYVEVAEPDMHEPTGDFERLARALREQWQVGGRRGATSPSCAACNRPCARANGRSPSPCTRATTTHGHASWTSGRASTRARFYGLAIDLGSTTIAAHLCDLRDGRGPGLVRPDEPADPLRRRPDEPGQLRDDEPRRRCRDDRAPCAQAIDTPGRRHCRRGEGATAMRSTRSVFVCNPVMHHLLLGIDPVELGQAPFALATCGSLSLDARDLDLGHVNRGARVYVLPCIAGHVGADAAAVALSEEPNKSEDMVLIVDVGTNAEILLGNETRVLACSSPTGPAFEGAQICSGQRAAPGAIERVEIDPVTKEPRFRVIGCDLWSDDPGFAAATAQDRRHRHLRLGHHRGGGRDAHGRPGRSGWPDRLGRTDRHRPMHPRRPHPCLPPARRHGDGRAEDHRHARRHPRDPAGEVRALCRRAAADGRDGRRQRGPRHPGRGLRRAYQPEARDGAGHDPRCAAGPGDLGRQRRRHRRAHRAAATSRRAAQIEATVHEIHKVETAIEPRFQEHFVNANAIPHATDPFPNCTRSSPCPMSASTPAAAARADGGGGAAEGWRRRASRIG